jgi:hypothetical protein
MTPFFIFIINSTPNYSLMRFHNNRYLIALVAFVCALYYSVSTFYRPFKPEPTSYIVSKNLPSYVIFAGALVMSLVM